LGRGACSALHLSNFTARKELLVSMTEDGLCCRVTLDIIAKKKFPTYYGNQFLFIESE
jgi:hypothetical protein